MQKGAPGQFEIVADGETVAKKGGGLLQKLLGGGWPDPDDVVARLRQRSAR